MRNNLVILLFLVCVCTLHSEYVHISKQTGEIPENKIYCAMTDTKGFVWFGTDNGALRWNGSKWTYMNERNSSLYSHFKDPFYISSMACNDDGVRYFGATVMIEYGSAFGLMTYDGNRWKGYDKSTSGLRGVNISSITCDGGSVWAMSEEGLNKFDGNNWKHFAFNEIQKTSEIPQHFKESKDYIDGKVINCKATTSNGEVWFGTNSGLYRNGKPYAEISDNITAIAVDAENKIYVGTANNGIYVVTAPATPTKQGKQQLVDKPINKKSSKKK
ncbi:MAG: hypothetical protein LBO69_09110 [Ignavibacteria bacterium]|jgi:ligand-binding sensor domain-containing protein|nr:hypothetical protein [Ignavibacteria bacterium]